MQDTYLKLNVEDEEFITWIKVKYEEYRKERLRRNTGKIHSEMYLGWLTEEDKNGWFWKKYPEMFKRLEQITYPYGEPVINSWIKFYDEGEYSALHIDDVNFISQRYRHKITWTNSILLEQSEDLEGADVVLAGDGFEPTFEQLKSRLITQRHNKVGDNIVWDSEIVHGISKIEKGYRMTLIVIKGKCDG